MGVKGDWEAFARKFKREKISINIFQHLEILPLKIHILIFQTPSTKGVKVNQKIMDDLMNYLLDVETINSIRIYGSSFKQ